LQREWDLFVATQCITRSKAKHCAGKKKRGANCLQGRNKMDHGLTKADQVVNEPRKSQENGTDILQLTSEESIQRQISYKRAKRRGRLTDTQTMKVLMS
jgi:hypothetical protein